MLEYILKAISRAIGFSKTEAKGSLVLIFVIFLAFSFFQYRVHVLRSQPPILPDSTDLSWLQEMDSIVQLKKGKEEPSADQPTGSIIIPKESKESSTVEINKPSPPAELKNLNLATAEELQEVKGIGPSFSSRIVKYRDLLGGYADSSQLSEVYGLKAETISELLKHFTIATPVQPINLNTDSLKHLAKHPYISYDLAKIIINYRKQHGDFSSGEDLRKIKAIDDSTFLRIKPYLK